MPKTVFFVRHAKSSWDDLGLRDHDRPLNKRGKRDGPLMAQKILELEGSIQQLISSTAKRAYQTCLYFQKAHGISEENLFLESELYHGDVEDYLDGVRTWGQDQFDNAALFAHNPGMTYLANTLAEAHIDNVPTCGVLKVEFDVKLFSEINEHNGELKAFYYPKMFI